MTELELYKFVNGNDIEHHKDFRGGEDVILFINIHLLDEWNKMVSGMLDDGVMECVMKEGYFCFHMNDICEYYDIKLESVFDFNTMD